MWNLFLKSIVQDLNVQLLVKDDSLPRAIFEEVLYQSCLQMVETYLAISPSRGRLIQYKIDVHFVLEIVDSWTSILSQPQQVRLYSMNLNLLPLICIDLITYFLTGVTVIICPIEVVLEYLSAITKKRKWDYTPSLEINKVLLLIGSLLMS